MSLPSHRQTCLLLALLLAASACGRVTDPSYPGEALATLEGQMSVAPNAHIDGPVRLALAWYPQVLGSDTAVLPSHPRGIVTEDVLYEGSFPLTYRFHLYGPPPVEALSVLGSGFQGKGALGLLLAYRDGNGNARLEPIPATGAPMDRVVGSSLVWNAAPAYFVLYLDSEQPSGTGLRSGFNLVRVSDADTSEPVPLSTRIPLVLSGGPYFDALVCEAGWSDMVDSGLCGLDFDGGSSDPDALLVEGSVRLASGQAEVDLLVTHEQAFVSDAQVTLGGRVIPFREESSSYGLVEAGSTLFTEGATVELRVVSRGVELRRLLSIPGGFDVTAPAPGAHVQNGAPLTIRWTRSMGAQVYDATLLGDSPFPVARVSTNELEYTFGAVAHSGPATLRVGAVSRPANSERLGWLDVMVVRELPLSFEP